MEHYTPNLLRPTLEVIADVAADAMYIALDKGAAYTRGKDLDSERHVDYGPRNQPIGIALLDVRNGVDIAGLPEAETVKDILRELSIPVVDSSKQG